MSRVHFASQSDKGLREINEDAYLAEKIGSHYVFAVADGLGGHAAGEVASGIAIECLRETFQKPTGSVQSMLMAAVRSADSRIRARSVASGEERGMATTLAAACVDKDLTCTIVNVGDSRGHLISPDGIEVTKDHSYVQELIDAGEISLDEAWHHPHSNVLRQALGDPDEDIRPDFYAANLAGTYLLLSTDGLHDYVKIGWIRDIIARNGEELGRSCDDLIHSALENDSDDNITAVLVHGDP